MLPSIQCHKWRTHEKLPHEILRLLVKTLGEVWAGRNELPVHLIKDR